MTTPTDTPEPARRPTTGEPDSVNHGPMAPDQRLPPVEPVIRPLDLDRDLATLVPLYSSAHPSELVNADRLRHDIAITSETRRLDLVAEVDGQVRGYAFTHLDTSIDFEGATIAQVMVEPAHRCRGIGQALAKRLREHWETIGSKVVVGRVAIEDSLIFAMRQRFAPTSMQRVSRLDLSTPVQVPPVPEGITLRTLAESDDYTPVYEVYTVVLNEVYNDGPRTPMPYDTWHTACAEDPLLDRETTVIAFDGDRPVAVSWMARAGDRLESMLGGVIPEYRGRSLSQLVRAESLRIARDNGVVEAFTASDQDNAAVFAVNDKLGYEPYIKQYTVMRQL
ncbi:GNAT family N-acetyltransferase [Stackebrandtia endophytica]|uniref:GNAT family N-acetyltransferase n=1 Tax=Stackebrandtia endophytica TaxID=1496996 RepID=UPI00114F21BE|nr:GNAT family N-acetyltransferase [Stackebrandtia endophytica]